MYRNRVNVYAGHREPQPFQHLFGVKSGTALAVVDEVRNRLRDERPRAAGWIEDVLALRIRHNLPDHGASQPVGRVVLTLAAGVRQVE